MSRGRFLALPLLVLATFMVAASPAAARTLVADDDLACSGATFSTIQSAVDAAVRGDVVSVCNGTYRESVEIGRDGIRLFSRVRHGAVIQPPSGTPYLGSAVNVSGRGAHVRGFSIVAESSDGCHDGIYVSGGATIDYNRIAFPSCVFDPGGGSAVAVFLFPLFESTVAHNEITGFGAAGVLFDGGDVSIHDNTIADGAGHGIRIDERGGEVKIQSNTIEDNGGSGISASAFASGLIARIAGNRIRRNAGLGIDTSYFGTGIENAHDGMLRVEANLVVENGSGGIRNSDGAGLFLRNRSLGNGGLDCADNAFSQGFSDWRQNTGVTDSPSTLCRVP